MIDSIKRLVRGGKFCSRLVFFAILSLSFAFEGAAADDNPNYKSQGTFLKGQILAAPPAARIVNKPNETLLSEDWDKAYNEVWSKISESPYPPIGSMIGIPGDIPQPFGVNGGRLSDDVFAAVAALTNSNREHDVSGVPQISMRLISRAESLLSKGEDAVAEQSLKLAQELSPRSSAVLFGLSRFVRLYGVTKCAGLYLQGLSALVSEPASCINLICFSLLLITASMFVALLIVCFMQIIMNLDALNRSFSLFFPRSMRRMAAPALLLFVIVFPITRGVLVTIIVWSLLLALLLPGRRVFHFAANLLMMASLLVFSVSLNLSQVLWGDVLALENLNKGAVTPEAVRTLARGAREGVLQQIRRATLGHLLLNYDQISAAEDVLMVRPEIPEEFEDLRLTNLVNQGALLLAKRETEAARDVLKEAEHAGENSFELYFNLSQASLSMVEMEGHRRYTSLARDVNPERFEDFEMHRDSGRGWLSKPLPSSILYRYMRTILFPRNEQVSQTLLEREAQLAQTLSPFDSLGKIYLFCILELGIFLAITLVGGAEGLVAELRSLVRRRPSIIWSLLPAGYQLATCRPVQATIGLGAIIGLLWTFGQVSEGSGAYISHSRALGWNLPFGWGAAGLYGFFTIVGIWQWSRDSQVGKRKSEVVC